MRPVAEAAQAIVGCLTGGGKLLVYGHGASPRAGDLPGRMRWWGASNASAPGWPRSASAKARAPLAAQIGALGSPGDLLVLLAANAADDLLPAEAVAHAHAKEMSVVALLGAPSDAVADSLTETDVLVAVGPERAARVHEIAPVDRSQFV